jgi:hypothetical protein
MTKFPSKSRKPTENTVEKQVVEVMQSRGWRATRNHVGLFHPYKRTATVVRIGEEFFPDWTFTRALHKERHGMLELIHWEAKAPGERPSKGQLEKIASLNYMGELSFWSDSLAMFEKIYAQYFPN